MVVWEMMSFKETQLNGIIVVVDGAGFSAKQLKVLTPYNIQKYVNLSVVCYTHSYLYYIHNNLFCIDVGATNTILLCT